MKSAKLFFSALIMVFVIWGCGGDNDADPKKDTDKNTYDRIDIIKKSLSNFITLEQLIEEGYTLEEFLLADVPVKDLKEYYSVKNLLDEDVPVDEMLNAGITVPELTGEGVTVKDFKDKDINPATLYYAEITVSALSEAGYTLGELLAAKIPVSALAEVYTIEELKNQQVSYSELLLAGASVQQLLDLGVTLADMYEQNVDPKLLFDDGITVEDLKGCGYTLDALIGAEIPLISLNEVYTLEQLLEKEIALSEFIDADFTIQELLDKGVTISDMQKENIDPLFLFENGIGVGTLEKSGYSSAILTNVQLIGSLEDIDGNSYKWVRIGEQTWMAENLRTTKYSNGDEINTDDPFENDDYVEFDNEEYTLKYGRYYHPTIINDSRGLCPTGWHIPDNNEIDILVNSLGGKNIAGAKLKEEGEEQWNFGNNGTNESGFSFPGSGKIINSWGASKNIDLLSDGYFLFLKNNSIDGFHLSYNSSEISYSYDSFQTIIYYSIRCMKD